MVLNKRFAQVALGVAAVMLSGLCLAEATGNATPTVYKVTVSDIKFRNTDSNFVTFASGTATFDIASAGVGEAIGAMSSSATLPPGTYNLMRFTLFGTMTLQGQYNGNLSNSLPCRTTNSSALLANPITGIDSAYEGSTSSGTPQPQSVSIPTGSGVTLPTSPISMTQIGSTNFYQVDVPVNFTIAEGTRFPDIQVNFDVTNSIQFEVASAVSTSKCIVFPSPPSISVSVT